MRVQRVVAPAAENFTDALPAITNDGTLVQTGGLDQPTAHIDLDTAAQRVRDGTAQGKVVMRLP
ncbi:MAG: hypothetical protein EA340_01810 [Nitriliruptor sp.]|nr:MAG: hypothetical protein EA340_01810 [Nitriliruptor sp.]TVR17377.1 MAG: hypothetical protein EA387_16560 [Nitriliruptor sp.]